MHARKHAFVLRISRISAANDVCAEPAAPDPQPEPQELSMQEEQQQFDEAIEREVDRLKKAMEIDPIIRSALRRAICDQSKIHILFLRAYA